MGSPTVASLFVQRVVIGVGDLAVSNSQVVLSTYALGSCVGIVAYDPFLRVGGLLHVMLPDSKIAPEKAAAHPAMFADTGLAQFFHELGTFKASAARLRIFLAGGASVISGSDPFRIGERNALAVAAGLSARGLRPHASELGGSINRTVHLDLTTGRLTLKTPRGDSEYDLAG
jgi:chemotaxis protein CheD